jgi:PAS domain S-box-containing protein
MTTIRNHVISIAIFFGLLVWFLDAVFDYLIFYDGRFWDLLILDIPRHEIYIRLVILTCFVIFGWIISQVLQKQLIVESALRESQEHMLRVEKHIGDKFIFYSRTMDGLLLRVSSGAKHLFNLDNDDVRSRSWEEVLPWSYESLTQGKMASEKMQSGKILRNTQTFQVEPKGGESVYLKVDEYVVDSGDGSWKIVEGIAQDVTGEKQQEQEREALIIELREALGKVKQLSGLLPICAHCKKIRDDKGYWNQLEHYIHDHSEAEFSHGICEECAGKYYPEVDLTGIYRNINRS